MKVVKKIIAFLIVLIVVIFAVTYIDYFMAKTNNTYPKLALKSENKEKEMITYKGFFYKMWNCTSEDTMLVGDYFDEDPVCPISYVFENGYYTNGAGFKISKRDIYLMISYNIYTNEMIDVMVSTEEVNNATYVAFEYGQTLNSIVEDKKATFEDDDKEYALIVHPKFEKIADDYKWVFNHENEEDYYCARVDEDGLFEYAKYYDGYCVGEFEPIKMSEKWCELYKNSTLVYSEELVKGLCE